MRPPYPPRPHRPVRPMPPAPSQFSWTPYIVMGVILFLVLAIAPRVGFWPLMLILVIGIPIARNFLRNVSRYWDANGENWKRRTGTSSRTYRASSATTEDEKPKGRPEYTVGDDGELIELDAALEDEKPKRGQGGSDTYV